MKHPSFSAQIDLTSNGSGQFKPYWGVEYACSIATAKLLKQENLWYETIVHSQGNKEQVILYSAKKKDLYYYSISFGKLEYCKSKLICTNTNPHNS